MAKSEKWLCLKEVRIMDGIVEKRFVPGMFYVGPEPKCGKGSSLAKSKRIIGKKGPEIITPAFELVKEPKNQRGQNEST